MEEQVMYIDEDELSSLQGFKPQTSGISNKSLGNIGSFTPKDNILGVFELEFKPFLEELYLDFYGIEYDKRTKKYIKSDLKRPLMPEECSHRLITFLKEALHLNNVLTNLDEDRIKGDLKELQKSLNRMLFRFGYYHSVNVMDLWAIRTACGQQIESMLYRAKNGQERIIRASNIHVNSEMKQSFFENEKPKKRLFSLFGKKGGE